jgi:beta-phosphoglucomutase
MNYRAILFDLDGVIVNSEPLHQTAFETTLKARGHNLSPDQYIQYFADKTDEAGFKTYFAAIAEPFDLRAIMAEKAQAYLDLADGHLTPYPGVIELIQDEVARNTPLALVTGTLRHEVELTLKTFGITHCFKTIIAAEDVAVGKPDPAGYIKAAQLLHVAPADCIVVEDSPSGLKAAQSAGIRCVVVTNTHPAAELPGATLTLAELKPGCLK